MNKNSSSPWHFLWSFVKTQRKLLCLALLSAAFAASMTLAVPTVFRWVIDQGFNGNDPNHLNSVFVWPMVLSVLLALSSAARSLFGTLLGEAVATDIKKNVIAHCLQFDPHILDDLPANNITGRITTDVLVLQDVLIPSGAVAVRNLLMFIGGIAMAAYSAPMLMLFVIGMVLPLLLVLRVVMRRSRGVNQHIQQADECTLQLLDETFSLLSIWQALGVENIFEQRISQAIKNSTAWRFKRAKIRAVNIVVVISLIFVAITIVLRLGAGHVLDGTMSNGTLAAFVLYSVFAAGAASSLSEIRTDINKTTAALLRLQQLMFLRPLVQSSLQPQAIPNSNVVAPLLQINNLVFGFPNRDGLILCDVSFSIKEGSFTVLTGASGLGKSALLLLLLRLRLPISGQIIWRGVSIDQFNLSAYRQKIAYVPQDTTLMNSTLRDNLLFGNVPEPDLLRQALAYSDLDTVLEKLPQHLNTNVGERGQALSGGQRQRAVIARALLCEKSELLLLDEPTSALDEASEQRVLAGLRDSKKTVLCISHSAAVLAQADTILTLDIGGTMRQSA